MTSIHDVAELEQTVYSLQKYIIGQKDEYKELVKEPMKEKELVKEKELIA